MPFCKACSTQLPFADFTKDGLSRHNCRECAKQRLLVVRGSTVARRLYFNLKQRLRNKGCADPWTLQDVQSIVDEYDITDDKNVRLERIDPDLPWWPNNVHPVTRSYD